MISFTPSLHSGFGAKVVIGNLGFAFNCRGDYDSLVAGHATALAPGKRPRSTLQGTLVLKADKPFLVTGSPGGDDQCMRTIQTFLNIVEFGMNVQQAIEAPRWATRSFLSSPFPHTMVPGDLSLEGRIPDSVRDELIRRSREVTMKGPRSRNDSAAIMVEMETGTVSAGADPPHLRLSAGVGVAIRSPSPETAKARTPPGCAATPSRYARRASRYRHAGCPSRSAIREICDSA